MKKLLLVIVLQLGFSLVYSQPVTELQETAKNFMRQGDYANAILVLNRAVQMEPQNIAVLKEYLDHLRILFFSRMIVD